MTLLVNAALNVDKTDIQKSKTRSFILGCICMNSTTISTTTSIEVEVRGKGKVDDISSWA
jgi:hypothetical protein